MRESERRSVRSSKAIGRPCYWLIRFRGDYLDANEAAVEFYGFSKAELCAMNITQINQLPGRKLLKPAEYTGTKGRIVSFPHRLRNGEIRTVRFIPLLSSMGGRTVCISIVHDVTERKRAEDKLEQMNEYLKNIFANSPDGIGIVDKRGKFIKWNKMAAGQHGYTF